MTVSALRVRGILDSRAKPTIEAEVTLPDGTVGRGSCPRAIAPGRRERPIGNSTGLGVLTEPASLLSTAVIGASGQGQVDTRLADAVATTGAAATLAVSVAYARATAAAARLPLWKYIASLAGTSAAPRLPGLLVNVFSGGIHDAGPAASYQQVMVVPRAGDLVSDIETACRVWAAAADLARKRFGEPVLSASSGILAPLDSDGQLRLLADALNATGLAGDAHVGIDVAAEHLRDDSGRYRLGKELLTAEELAAVLCKQASDYGIGYIEDPFDAADEKAWRLLRANLPASSLVYGDDLYATDAQRITADLADGILLKPSQVGTITGLVDAAVTARRAGLALAVSHRSGETEDTVICDIASALGADLIKVGGPRRGDRLAKYNQLLRLSEELADSPLETR